MIDISVIIPVYNVKQYLNVALESISCQTLANIEIICIDDGSTDGSFEILQRYAKRDNRFILLQQENQYAGAARNNGMRIARGKYLSFLDADDHFKSDMLEKAYLCAERESADVVVFGVNLFQNEPSESWNDEWWLKESMLPDGDGFKTSDYVDLLFNFTGTAAWNKLFKREFIMNENLLFQGIKRWNDVFFVQMALALSNKIGIVRKNLIDYRIGNKDSLQGTRDESFLDSIKAFYKVHEELSKRKLYEKLGHSFRNECIAHFTMLLESAMSKENFGQLFELFKGKIFEQFHLTGLNESDFLDEKLYQEFCFIQNHTAAEYALKKYSEEKQKTEKYCPFDYIFPFEYIDKGSRIVLYGAGRVGHVFYKQVLRTEYCFVVAWIDKKAQRLHDERIKSVNTVEQMEFDYVVIAIESSEIAQQIKRELIEIYGIPLEKII